MEKENTKKPPLAIRASRKSDLPYDEVHKEVGVAFDEEAVEEVRKEILDTYGVLPENVAIYPEQRGEKRGIRIFMILENRETGEKYYGDGHAPHAVILNYLFQNFPQIGIKDRQEIFEDLAEFRAKWKTIKGFIDPYLNGFRDFPKTRSYLIREMRVQGQNGLTEEQVEALKNASEKNDIELPNWILSV